MIQQQHCLPALLMKSQSPCTKSEPDSQHDLGYYTSAPLIILWAIPGASSYRVHGAIDHLQTKLLAEKWRTYEAYMQDTLSTSDTRVIFSLKDCKRASVLGILIHAETADFMHPLPEWSSLT